MREPVTEKTSEWFESCPRKRRFIAPTADIRIGVVFFIGRATGYLRCVLTKALFIVRFGTKYTEKIEQ